MREIIIKLTAIVAGAVMVCGIFAFNNEEIPMSVSAAMAIIPALYLFGASHLTHWEA